MSEYDNRVKLTGTLVSKRLSKTKKDSVLNLFVRTGNSRGAKFCISVSVWGKQAKILNKALRAATDGIKDGEILEEDEAPLLKIMGELRYEFWEDDDGEKHDKHSIVASKITIEDDDEEEEDEYEDEDE